jgi:hypothetical protein
MATMENASACVGMATPGVAVMPGCVVTPLATRPGSATTEPTLGWSSKLLRRSDFFYTDQDTDTGKHAKSVQE